MKTFRSLALLTSVGALLAPASSVRAEKAVRLDDSGHLITPLSLKDSGFRDTLDSARLPADAAFHTLSVSNQTLFTGPMSLPANQPITLASGDISGSILTIGAGGVFAPQTLPAGHSLRRNSANTAFEDYTPNTGDGSALTNLNAAALSTGVAAPARLGTGTPSSSTVLRGDGTWAGTTSTGNTLAVTSNVLMGDNAGNAVAIGNGADLARVFRARLDSLQASQTPPVNLLPASKNGDGIGLTRGTINADGTMTIPANDHLQWQMSGDPAPVPLYGYVVATTEQPGGALSMHARSGYDRASTDTTILPGAYRSAFSSLTDSNYQIVVNNNTGSPITIYYPVAAAQDTGLALLQSCADRVPVAAPPVADLDFTRFADADRATRYLAEKQTTLAADSVNGSSANAGTLYAPKAALPTTITNPGSVVGLYRGSVFRASLPIPNTVATHGIVVQDAAFGSVQPLPIVSALDPVNNAGIVNNGDGTYSIQWNPTETLTNNGYANVYVVEINTVTEATTPVASRRRMTDVSSSAAAGSTPGSVYVTTFGGGWLAQLHPSDSLAPGSGTYRYEVVARVQPANWGSGDANPGDGAMGGLRLAGGNSGYGALGAPPNFAGDRLVLLHASTHNAVIGGGSLQRSVFYESGNPNAIQLAWYLGNPAGLRWNLHRCLFYANVGDRPANCVISHSTGPNYDRGDISDTAFLGARWSNGSLHGTAIDYVNVSTGVIERVYVQGIKDMFGTNMPPSREVRNSVFRQVHNGKVVGNFHDNIVLTESGSDSADAGNRYPTACVFAQSSASATNNLFWGRGISTGVGGDDQASGINSAGSTSCTFQRNIIVLNPAATTSPSQYFYHGGTETTTLSMDYNLVINLAKGGFSAQGPGGGYTSWSAYQTGYPALDQHSLFVDLSGDPRGIQAVFADPINGDFRWAQTEVARKCAAFCKANKVGPATVPSRWPLVPTVDEAVRLLTGL